MTIERDSKRGDASQTTVEGAVAKEELQRRMEQTRESISQTVEEIKETVTEQYESVKETVSGVFDYREYFKEEPLVWSLGALSAGFALGYTLGYAHKNSKASGHSHSQITAFAGSIFDELSGVGQSLVMPTLNAKIKELFGVDFTKLLDELGGIEKSSKKKTLSRKGSAKKSAKKASKR